MADNARARDRASIRHAAAKLGRGWSAITPDKQCQMIEKPLLPCIHIGTETILQTLEVCPLQSASGNKWNQLRVEKFCSGFCRALFGRVTEPDPLPDRGQSVVGVVIVKGVCPSHEGNHFVCPTMCRTDHLTLLEMTTSSEIHFELGDGVIQCLIRPEDLKARRFDRVVVVASSY